MKIKMNLQVLSLWVLAVLSPSATAFVMKFKAFKTTTTTSTTTSLVARDTLTFPQFRNHYAISAKKTEEEGIPQSLQIQRNRNRLTRQALSLIGTTATTLLSQFVVHPYSSSAMATVLLSDESEVSVVTELPPTYVPVAFGLVLLVGVALLTSSLGNVMDEEAKLGVQSGARARKEMERSRSSYFKK